VNDEEIKINVVYDVKNINNSIKDTQRMLYFTNALRLSILDIQQVMSGPTISNVMWTAVQLTRVWTHLYRMIDKTNKAQAAGIGLGAARGMMAGAAGMGAARGFAAGQQTLAGGMLGGVGGVGLWTTLGAFAFTNPYTAVAALAVMAASGLGYRKYFKDRKARTDRREFLTRQREIAKSQGYEY